MPLDLGKNVRGLLCTQSVDMRRSFNGLSVLLMDVLEADPLSGQLFVCFNSASDNC